MPFRSRRQLSHGFSPLKAVRRRPCHCSRLTLKVIFFKLSLLKRESQGKACLSEKYECCLSKYFIPAITLTLFFWRLLVSDLVIAPTSHWRSFFSNFPLLSWNSLCKGSLTGKTQISDKNEFCLHIYFIPASAALTTLFPWRLLVGDLANDSAPQCGWSPHLWRSFPTNVLFPPGSPVYGYYRGTQEEEERQSPIIWVLSGKILFSQWPLPPHFPLMAVHLWIRPWVRSLRPAPLINGHKATLEGVDARIALSSSWRSKKAPWVRGGWGEWVTLCQGWAAASTIPGHTSLHLPLSLYFSQSNTPCNPPPCGKQSTHPPTWTSSFCSAHFYCII